MPQPKSTSKVFHLNAIIDGRLIVGSVRISPTPTVGIMTELARFEAERALVYAVRIRFGTTAP